MFFWFFFIVSPFNPACALYRLSVSAIQFPQISAL
jgi:hypothetical protein